MKEIKLAKINPEQVSREIEDFILSETLGENRTGGIIGLSGGVDSTTTATLAKRAFDRYNGLREVLEVVDNPKRNLELVGYFLPSKLNAQADEDDGRKVAERLGIRSELVNIQPLVEAYALVDPRGMESKFNKGNRISELRAAVLHGKAAYENKILLGTGNKDEDFGVGYYTLFGDGAVRISPIGMLSKRLVRDLARYLGFPDLADRVSSPGLEPGQTAFGDLGYRYEVVVELYANGLEQGFNRQELLEHPQLLQEAEKNIREYEQAFSRRKFQTPRDLIKDIERRNLTAIGKSRIVSPPIAKITLNYN
jgi:NAD+ synthase